MVLNISLSHGVRHPILFSRAAGDKHDEGGVTSMPAEFRSKRADVSQMGALILDRYASYQRFLG